MIDWILGLVKDIIRGYAITREDARKIVNDTEIYDLLYGANRIREHFLGKEILFCSIVNAKSGACSEDCKFCAQSARYNTGVMARPLLTRDDALSAKKAAVSSGAQRFDFVTSGECLNKDDFQNILRLIRLAAAGGQTAQCASLGILNDDQARQLKDAGLTRFNHNLETSRSFFPKICSTHPYDARAATIKAVKKAGIEACSGGIFGIGEDWKDRIDLAITLRELDVDAVPLNFLYPIKGTPLAEAVPLKPMEILRIIALYRFMFPSKDIQVCGGREKNLRDIQSWIYYAGANGAIIGNYLTTKGRPAGEDWRMVEDLGLTGRGLAGLKVGAQGRMKISQLSSPQFLGGDPE